MHEKVIPIDRPRAEPTLYNIPKSRLVEARHKAANAATIALMSHRPTTYRQWMRVVDQCDAELHGESVA